MTGNRNPWSTSDWTLEDAPSGIVMSVWSWARMLNVPPALNVTWKVAVPPTSCAGAGSVALASVAWISIASVVVGTRFQPESQARTVTVNGTFAVWRFGVPVLPVVVPGAALSPGSNT